MFNLIYISKARLPNGFNSFVPITNVASLAGALGEKMTTDVGDGQLLFPGTVFNLCIPGILPSVFPQYPSVPIAFRALVYIAYIILAKCKF